MTRHLPAPDPRRPDDVPVPEDPAAPDLLDGLDDDLEVFDPALLDPDAWPDDAEDPTATLDDPTDDSWMDLSVEVDDGPGPDWAEVAEPDDDLLRDDDLDTEESLPILPVVTEAEVDGVLHPAQAAPHAPRSCLREPGATPGERMVEIRVGGIAVHTTVEIAHGDVPQLSLGQDVLSGRFLLRP